jgi:tetratricopeptide (TPR) repeat protein
VPENEGKALDVQLAIGQGQMSEAERTLTGMLEKNPGNMEVLNQRAMIYLYTWQLEKARADLEKMNKTNSGGLDLDGRIRLVKLECEMGRVAEAERGARELITRAVGQSSTSVEKIRGELLPSLASVLPERNYEELLTWANKVVPGYWGWWYALGQFQQTRQNYGPAANAFRQAWDGVENIAKIPAGLKLVILDSYLEVMYRQAEYSKVIQTAERALSRLPKNSSRISAWQAAAYYAGGQKKKGLDLFLKSLESADDNPLSIWQMTRDTILKASKGRDLAVRLEEKVGSNPKAWKEQVALAGCYFTDDQIEKGDALYRKLVTETQNPQFKAIFLFTLAQEYSEKHKYAEAAKVLVEAQKIMPDNPAILNNLAYILVENLNKPQDALTLIRDAYQKDPNNPDLLDTYGQVLFKVNRPEEGLQHLARSVWARASSANRYHLGMALLQQKRTKDAEAQLRRALPLAGQDKELEKQIREALNTINKI